MSKGSAGGNRFLSAVKEKIRKIFVSIKRNPQIIAGAVMVIAFVYFSLNLTDVSDTTAKIQGKGMGLSAFCVMLLSILSFVCFLNAFPKRKKVNIPMLILMFVMIGVIVFCDMNYMNRIFEAVHREVSPISIKDNPYILAAYNMLNTHTIMLYVTIGLLVLLPIYGRLLKKINTSIDVEDNGAMAEIDISSED